MYFAYLVNLRISPGFIGSLVNFVISNSHFPFTVPVLDMFSGAYLKKLTVCMVPSE